MLLVLDVLTFDLFLRSPNFMTSMEYPLIFMHIWRVFKTLAGFAHFLLYSL